LHTVSVQLLSDPVDELIARAYEKVWLPIYVFKLFIFKILIIINILKIENNEAMQSVVNGHNASGVENEIDNTAELWVQKYKPNKYLDLLSDESINRLLLHWFKLWDKVVFNKNINKKRKNTIEVYDKSTGMFFNI